MQTVRVRVKFGVKVSVKVRPHCGLKMHLQFGCSITREAFLL